MAVLTEDRKGHLAHTQDMEEASSLPGKLQQPIKLVMLGAGSGFTPRLVNDLLHIPSGGAEVVGGQIALVDLDAGRLTTMLALIRKLIEQHGKGDAWTVVASQNRREVMAGASYIVNCIEVSGVQCVHDGQRHPAEVRRGPMHRRHHRAWRAVQSVADRAGVPRRAERCRGALPGVIVLNYTNPMSILCLAAGRKSKIQVVGLCHSVQGTSRKIAKDAGVAYEEVAWQCAGINHLAWFTRFEHQGRSLYPHLTELVKDHTARSTNPTRCVTT